MINFYQISFQVWAKSIIKISWIRMNTNAPMKPMYNHAIKINQSNFIYGG